MRRVLFLDFDGVLNNMSYLTQQHELGYRTTEAEGLDPARIRFLDEIVEAVPGLEIVISSSWRIGRSVDDLQNILALRGFMGWDRIVDKTGHDPNGKRGMEIDEWIRRQQERPKRIVILDDDIYNMDPWKDHVIQTSFMGAGLTNLHVRQIIDILT
jgi:hypothetical protein